MQDDPTLFADEAFLDNLNEYVRIQFQPMVMFVRSIAFGFVLQTLSSDESDDDDDDDDDPNSLSTPIFSLLREIFGLKVGLLLSQKHQHGQLGHADLILSHLLPENIGGVHLVAKTSHLVCAPHIWCHHWKVCTGLCCKR